METAVTIPNEIFQQAEELAHRIGLSRDELYTQALKRLLELSQDDEITRRLNEITRRLNEIYTTEESALDPALMLMQTTALEQEEW